MGTLHVILINVSLHPIFFLVKLIRLKFNFLIDLYNIATKFGAMLDQLTDRCGTMCLLVTLSFFYPKYMFWFQLSMAIDVAGHWIYLHASLLIGKTSHKSVDPNENAVMRLYYTKPILLTMCVGNELFYSALYLLYFTTGPTRKFV